MYKLYDSIDVTIFKWHNYKNGEQASGFQGFGTGVVRRWVWLKQGNARELCGSGNAPYLDNGCGYTNLYMW